LLNLNIYIIILITNNTTGGTVLRKPEAYHGKNRLNDRNFFEGVYYKLIDKEEKHAYAFIPGIAFGKDKTNSHAFIQAYNGKDNIYTYHKFDINDFYYSKNDLDLRIGKNHFTKNHILIDINDDERQIKGELKLDKVYGWPPSFLSPGAMGWFETVPFMECYYGVISFNNTITGKLMVDGDEIDFTSGKGYIEKNWGKSFPKSWIWMQSNLFEGAEASVVISVAHIPWLFSFFPGFVMGFYYQGELYQFATYNRSKIKDLNLEETKTPDGEPLTIVNLDVINKHYRLAVKAHKVGGIDLKAPIIGEMIGRCNESLKSYIDLSFYSLKDGKDIPIFTGKGTSAGVEVNGDISKLISALKLK
jgi:tocopherol cyclase